MPMRMTFTHLMFKFPRIMAPMLMGMDDGIPGYRNHWGRDMMTGMKKLKRKKRN